MLLALCHSITVEIDKGERIYNSASPDELALVQFARYSGWEFKEINSDGDMVILKRRKPGDEEEECTTNPRKWRQAKGVVMKIVMMMEIH